MARSLKISFPLPRRPSTSPHTTPGSQYSNQSNVDDSPLSHPGAKAEKVLGASEADTPELKKKRSKKGKKQLRKHPSFISVTLSDVDAESVKTPDEFPFPGMQTPSEIAPQSTQGKGRQGSSPLLREHDMSGVTKGIPLKNSSGLQARRADNSSTLRPHYDPKNSPLSISQQTSASSARDMALRKGFPPISSPPSLGMTEADRSTEPDVPHSRNISTDTGASRDSKLSGNSINRINSIPRRRPSVTDPPTLHPHANRAFHAFSPPPALVTTALPKPLGPQSQQKVSLSRPRWWAKVKTQMYPSTPIDDQQPFADFDDLLPSIKLNVRKPEAQPEAGMRNWFDGLGDEEVALNDTQDCQSKYPIQESYKSPVILEDTMTQGAPSQHIAERKRSYTNKSDPTTFSDKKSSLRFESPSIHGHNNGSSLQALEDMSTSGSAPGSLDTTITRRTTDSKGRRTGVDLQVISFLELSSSEDETESNSDAPCRRHRIRASIERNSYNNEVSVGNAQRAHPVRPRSIVNGRTRPHLRRPNSSEKVPPVPKIPNKPRVSQRTSSVRWREMIEDRAGSTESTIDSGRSSLSGSIDAQRATTRKSRSIRRSRLMKVTSEEEKLLEAMREKRASIRQDDFDKGFKTALQLQDLVARPRTAGGDGRASQSSSCRHRSSISPPSQEHTTRTKGGISGFSISAEDLRLEDAFPFPNVPITRKGQVSPPRPSPSLSFSPSDILPGTPASHNSPLTPPPAHGGMGAYGRSLTLSPPQDIASMSQTSHERKRTVSSGVVDIDGVGPQAQVIDEDGVSRWTMDRW